MVPARPAASSSKLSRPRLIAAVAAALAIIIGASIGIGFAAGGGDDFDWSVWALVLTALATLGLASMTAFLASSTWQDVRASQLVAQAAHEANELVRTQQERRPRLTLRADEEKLHSHAELGGVLWVRLLVENATGVRAATGTRVLVDRCILPSERSSRSARPRLAGRVRQPPLMTRVW